MSLLQDVLAVLEAEKVDHALIGAAALAIHGVSRATADVDLLTVEERVLEPKLWRELETRGVAVRALKGDFEDPLAGSVRLSLGGGRIVDVVVGRYEWQKEIIQFAEVTPIGEVSVKVARPAGLVLLKLYAGGPKDAWDIRSLLESHEEADSIKAEVHRVVARLPSECATLWKRLCDEP